MDHFEITGKWLNYYTGEYERMFDTGIHKMVTSYTGSCKHARTHTRTCFISPHIPWRSTQSI